MRPALFALTFLVGVLLAAAQTVVETILPGARFSAQATSDGEPAPAFEWLKDGVKIASGPTFTIEAVELSHSGEYTARATNSEGFAVSPIYELKVEEAPAPPPPPTGDLPVFTLHPASQTAAPLSTVTFAGRATGATSYKWFRNGITFPEQWNTDTLSLSHLTENDAGAYVLYAKNDAGTVMSNPAALTIEVPVPPLATAPVFIRHPADTLINVGFGLRLEALVMGNPVPDLQWEKDGALIAGATESVYSKLGVSTGDAGTYVVTARSSSGVATSNPALVSVREPDPVGTPPKILAGLADITAPKKAKVRFEIGAEGEGLRYQWKKGTSNLVGQTAAALVIEQVNPSHGGTYTVTVSNPRGSVTTSARLTVR